MHISIPVLLVCIFSACTNHQKKVTTFQLKEFTLTDTGFASTKFLDFDVEETYPVYYLGPLIDKIGINRRYDRIEKNWSAYKYIVASKTYSAKTLELHVDTSVKTNSPVDYFSPETKEWEDSTENYHAFLLTIKNIGDTTIYMGRTFSLYFLNREAKDKNGNWITIDQKRSDLGLCMTGEPDIFLKKNEIILSKVKCYKGKLLTEFRLAFGKRSKYRLFQSLAGFH